MPAKQSQTILRFTSYNTDPITLARKLLGQRLVRNWGGVRLVGTIVEVEAYLGEPDRAAHTFNGRRTKRNASMYLPAGHAYVYFTYGMHHCMNVVCGKQDEGVAVLLRAIEPIEGLDLMYQHRAAAKRDLDLCSGPAKLTQALAIDLTCDGINMLTSDNLFIEQQRSRRLPDRLIGRSARIGVGYADSWAKKPLRYFIVGNPYVSRATPAVKTTTE